MSGIELRDGTLIDRREPGQLDELTIEFSDIDQFLYMGAEDENDTIPYEDSWSSEQREIALEVYGEDMQADRFPFAESVYNSVDASAEFKIYEDTGHEVTPEVFQEIVDFYKRTLEGQFWESGVTEKIERALGVDVPESLLAGGLLGSSVVGGLAYLWHQRGDGSSDE